MESVSIEKYKMETPLKDSVHSPKTPQSENIFHNGNVFDIESRNSTINKFNNLHSSPPSVISNTPLKFTFQISANGKASLSFCEENNSKNEKNGQINHTLAGNDENKENIPVSEFNQSKSNDESKNSTPLKHEKNKILSLLKQMKNNHSSSNSISSSIAKKTTNNKISKPSMAKKLEFHYSSVTNSPLQNMIMLPSSPPIINNINDNNHTGSNNTGSRNNDISHIINSNNESCNALSIPPSTPRNNIHYSNTINPNYSNLISNMGLTPLLPLDQVLLETTPRLNRILPPPHQFPFKNIGSDPLLMNEDDHWNVIINGSTHPTSLNATNNSISNNINAMGNITNSPLKDHLLKTPFVETNTTSPMKRRKLSLTMTPLIQQTMAGSLSAKCVQQYSLSPNVKKINNSFNNLNNDNEIVRDDASMALKNLINR